MMASHKRWKYRLIVNREARAGVCALGMVKRVVNKG
ncbi:hypothetical protein JOE33_005055 [Pseudomonas sp. PvP027]|nr:hypothetical protein [Pseudomonas sp. PvP027]